MKKKENPGENGRNKSSIRRFVSSLDELNGLAGRITDMGKEKKSGDVKLQENSYYELFNTVTEAIYIQKFDGTFIDVNNGAVQMYGYTHDELVGRNPEFVSAPGKNDLENITDIIKRVADTGKPEQFEFWGIRKNGEIFPKEVFCNKGKYFGEEVIISTARDITERKQAEKSIKESEEKYRMLLELAADAFFQGDATGNFIMVNNKAIDLTGHSREELLKMNMRDLFTKEILDINSLRYDLLKQGETIKSERKIIRKDGSFISVEMNSKLMPDGSYQSFFRDITGRKQAEEEIRQNKERLNRGEFVAKAGNWELHLDSGSMLASEGAYKLYGLETPKKMLLPEVQKLVLPEFRPILDNALYNLVNSGEPYNVEFKIKRAGSNEIVDIHSIAEFDREKRIVFGVIQDITERKRAEQIQKVLYNISGAVSSTSDIEGFMSYIQDELGTLLDTSNFYIAFYDEATDMLVSTYCRDENDDLDTWPAKNSLTGYVVKNNKPLLVKNNDVFKQKWLEEFYQTGTNSEVWLGVPLREDGKAIGAFVVQSYSDPSAYDEKDVEMLEFISDQISISIHRKKVEQAIKAAKEKAEESDRLKTAFLANMSHEIRTPMNGILGFAELLDDNSLSQERRREFTSIISSSSKQLLTVINDIIDISKIESGQLILSNVHFNLNKLLGELLTAFENIKATSGKSHINLILEKGFTDDESEIYCDDMRLSQVLNNLLGNALKFTSSGFVKFGYRRQNENLLFYVQDTGKGIALDKQQYVFERFRQAEESNTRRFGGTGLGLSISKGLVELMSGNIWVVSDEEIGSTFYFSIPVNIQPPIAEITNGKHPVKVENGFSGKTILIAEDIQSNFDMIRIMLEKTNAILLYAEDGAQAVDICKKHDKIDLVLMDIQMPVLNGYDATREIRKFRSELPIIALTAFAYEEDKIRCFDAGCNDFIAKPIDRYELVALISKFLIK
jgi:PAS domain S-box-containing protein